MQANAGLRFPTRPGRPAPPASVVGLSVLLHAALLAVLVVIAGQPRPLPSAVVDTSVAMVFEPAAPAPAAASQPETPAPPPVLEPIQPPPPPAPEPPPPEPPPAPVMAPPPVEPGPAPAPAVAAPEPPREMARPVVPERHPPPRPSQARFHPRPASFAATSSAPEKTALASAPAGPTAAIIPPRPVAGIDGNLAPSYPESARRRGEQGRVMLRVTVSIEGSPTDVSVADSSGHPILDEAAVSAVRRWRFTPATRAGQPLVATAEVPVVFRLME
jgi:protein TonB